MFGPERQQAILAIIKEKKFISVSELSERVFASPATIRRDLTAMEKLGLIKRSHGGAMLYEKENEETSFFVREHENVKAKKKIVDIAKAYIKNSYSIFMDSSSTCNMLVPALSSFKGLTVFTTGIKNAILLSEKTNAKVFVPGGEVNTKSNSISGSYAYEYLSKTYTDIAFVSCNGIDVKSDATEHSFEQAHIKRTALRNSKLKILLCDSSKFEVISSFKIADFSMFDFIISNERPSDNLKFFIEKQGCKLIWK